MVKGIYSLDVNKALRREALGVISVMGSVSSASYPQLGCWLTVQAWTSSHAAHLKASRYSSAMEKGKTDFENYKPVSLTRMLYGSKMGH